VPLTPGSAYSPSDFASAKSLSASGGERENIMVAVRCRPFIKEEAARGADTSSKRAVKLAPDSVQCEWKEDKKTFTFDHVRPFIPRNTARHADSGTALLLLLSLVGLLLTGFFDNLPLPLHHPLLFFCLIASGVPRS
jgi:hypothetical protein